MRQIRRINSLDNRAERIWERGFNLLLKRKEKEGNKLIEFSKRIQNRADEIAKGLILEMKG